MKKEPRYIKSTASVSSSAKTKELDAPEWRQGGGSQAEGQCLSLVHTSVSLKFMNTAAQSQLNRLLVQSEWPRFSSSVTDRKGLGKDPAHLWRLFSMRCPAFSKKLRDSKKEENENNNQENFQNHSSNTLKMFFPIWGSLRCHRMTVPHARGWCSLAARSKPLPFPSVDTGGKEKGKKRTETFVPSIFL